jgi:hypothetical protein
VCAKLEGLEGQLLAHGYGDRALGTKLGGNPIIVTRIADYGYAGVVLGGCPQEGYATYVYLLHAISLAYTFLCYGFFKGVEVADDHVYLRAADVGELCLVGIAATGQDTAVDGGVQCLDPSAEYLRRVRVL